MAYDTVSTVVPLTPTLCLTLTSLSASVMLTSGAADMTGSSLWPSTRLLAEVLASTLLPAVRGGRVIELGCGTALVSSAAAVLGAAVVLATDGEARVLPLAEANIARAAVPGCDARAALLRWGDAEHLANATAGGLFSLALAAESLYVHRGAAADSGDVIDHASTLFATARAVLEPCSCPLRSDDASCSAGTLLLLYTPRYRSMATAVRAAAATARLSLCCLHTPSLMTPLARSSHAFGDVRLAVACACAHALGTFLTRHGLVVASACDEADAGDEPEEAGVGAAADLFS